MMRRIWTSIVQLWSGCRNNFLVSFSVPFIVGAYTTKRVDEAIYVGAIILSVGFLFQIRKLWSIVPVNAKETQRFLRPDSDALGRVYEANKPCLVSQNVIEVIAHPSLSTRKNFDEIGWETHNIQLESTDSEFDAKEILSRIGGEKEFKPPNGRKYSLVDHSHPGSDTAQKFILKVSGTRFFTVRSIHQKIVNEPALRRRLGSLDPAENKIANSLCLHFVVRFLDGTFLVLRNSARKDYAAYLWSFSAEETMNEDDVLSGNGDLSLFFRRAVAEEIFGLTDGPTSDRWELIKDWVKSTRVWSIFLEEQINNYCLLGACQLNRSPEQLREWWQTTHRDRAVSDNEGEFFFVTEKGLESLLNHPKMPVTGIFSKQKHEVHEIDLHLTSRYRIFRTLRALKKKPLYS